MDPSPGQIPALQAVTSPDPAFSSIIIKAPRGGGKTKLGAAAFAYLQRIDPTWKIFVQSGSYRQARYLYSYYKPIVLNPDIFPQDWLVGKPTMYWTEFKQGGSLEILPASERRSRGGHVDIACADEAVLFKPELIDALWPTTRTSRRPKHLIMSTASPGPCLEWFVEVWQNPKAKGFVRYGWPPEECAWINPEETARAALVLDSETLRVEYGGEIGERKGRVWDSALIDGIEPDIPHAVVDPNDPHLYPDMAAHPLTEKWTALDWGFVGAAVLLFFEKQGDTVFVRDCRTWQKTSYTEIKHEIRDDFGLYPIYPDSEAAADNADLEQMGLKVTPVVFSKDKGTLISNVRWRLENGLLRIPDPAVDETFFTLVQQMKAYHYDKSGKPAKVNDHCVDALLCGMKPWLPSEVGSRPDAVWGY
jgi:hypothetical protein